MAFRHAFIAATLMLWGLSSAPIAAGVFGDGNPENGTEDDRRSIREGQAGAVGDAWFRSGGTIHCDGRIRGSATLVRPAGTSPERDGRFIATAAHVLFNLATGAPWANCRFHYLGLGALPSYGVDLVRGNVLLGRFDPRGNASNVDSGAGDWAFAWLGADWAPPEGATALELYAPGSAASIGGGVFGLLAWNRSADALSVSLGCRVIDSEPEDLGGGGWAGQLLDDCDSSDGASGGALILERDGVRTLVAIRGGQHWDPLQWPLDAFPDGPPEGEPWDPQRFTNYARALDQEILSSLDHWLRTLPSRQGEDSTVHPGQPGAFQSDARARGHDQLFVPSRVFLDKPEQ